MHVKRWICSENDHGVTQWGDVTLPTEDTEMERMLGVLWDSAADSFKFTVQINLSPIKKKSRQGPDISLEELLRNPPLVVTRRQYYSQVQSLFDPVGFLAPVLLTAKILLRKTWEEECQKFRWDDPLPSSLVDEIVAFFAQLFDLENISFKRSFWPVDEGLVGNPGVTGKTKHDLIVDF